MKGVIRPDHIPTNKYHLVILGLPPLTPTEFSGLEDELQTVDMPDRTVATGGNRGSSEASMMIPMHHTVERAACELWYQEAQEPVSPTYKKACTLIMISGSGAIVATYSLVGVFIKKRVLPDLELAGDGEMAAIEYTLSVDDVLPL
jgi:hypothetical protein